MINALLDDFLYLIEQCADGSLDKGTVVSSDGYIEVASKIKSVLLQYGDEAESEFSLLLESIERDNYIKYSNVERIIDNLRVKIEKRVYRT